MANNLIRKRKATGGGGGGGSEMASDWIKVTFGDHHVLMAKETFDFYEPKSLTLECRESGVMSSHRVDVEEVNVNTTIKHWNQPIKTIHDLPDEMVSRIVSFVETTDLIRKCRLVSKKWKNVSSELCRKRFVGLKKWKKNGTQEDGADMTTKSYGIESGGKAEDIFSLFDMENLPWSAYEYEMHTVSTCEDNLQFQYNRCQNDKFLKFFGKHIWSLTCYEKDAEEWKKILCHTPNIRQMEAYFWGETWTGSDVPGGEELDLRKLKRLKLNSFRDCHVELLNYLITTGKAKLDHFKSIIQIKSSESVGLLASLLANVPSIWFHISYEPSNLDDFKILLTKFKNLRITELEFDLRDSDRDGVKEHPISYNLPERFVATHSEHLERLALSFTGVHSPFNFPTLPALTSVLIRIGYEFETRPYSVDFLSFFQSHQFPVLDEVEITEVGQNPGLDVVHLSFDENSSFESVSKLTVDLKRRVRGDLGRIFPNLKSLTFKNISDSETLVGCFSHESLENLSLHISHHQEGMDLNVLLSGIPNPDPVFYEKSEEEIVQERARHGLPSILQLTRLKNLSIDFDFEEEDSSENLRDAGARLSLLQLHPLNLTLIDTQVSERCIRKLNAHHRTVRIY